MLKIGLFEILKIIPPPPPQLTLLPGIAAETAATNGIGLLSRKNTVVCLCNKFDQYDIVVKAKPDMQLCGINGVFCFKTSFNCCSCLSSSRNPGCTIYSSKGFRQCCGRGSRKRNDTVPNFCENGSIILCHSIGGNLSYCRPVDLGLR